MPPTVRAASLTWSGVSTGGPMCAKIQSSSLSDVPLAFAMSTAAAASHDA